MDKICNRCGELFDPRPGADTCRRCLADVDAAYIAAGVISPEEVAASRWGESLPYIQQPFPNPSPRVLALFITFEYQRAVVRWRPRLSVRPVAEFLRLAREYRRGMHGAAHGLPGAERPTGTRHQRRRWVEAFRAVVLVAADALAEGQHQRAHEILAQEIGELRANHLVYAPSVRGLGGFSGNRTNVDRRGLGLNLYLDYVPVESHGNRFADASVIARRRRFDAAESAFFARQLVSDGPGEGMSDGPGEGMYERTFNNLQGRTLVPLPTPDAFANEYRYTAYDREQEAP